ncbi:S9 family peptidase [Pedobacter yulinensis]|uniref:S9 family peptidase n=1 Tax=Pedobacter yulinensis TaxID=2126353 RepID=A0A2T3HQK9_9SPHI|nr:prolyl oligopeptidase family serine peptidase [Pedobacter yulinensis]PST84683.1 S9 family peptidase [Pedobacter yulinensis]
MRVLKNLFLLFVLSLLFACKPGVKTGEIAVNDFFKSQDRAQYKVSPDGKTLSYLKLQDNLQNLFTEDIATGKVTQLSFLKSRGVRFYLWVSKDELIFYRDQPLQTGAEMYIVNKNEGAPRKLSADPKAKIRVLEDQLIDNKFLLVASNKRDSTVFDVYKLNIRDGSLSLAARNPGNIADWITDAEGRLKLAIASDGVNETLLFRDNESQAFRPVIKSSFKNTLVPIGFAGKDGRTVYAISNINRDKNALIELDMVTGKEQKVLFYSDSLNVVEGQYSRAKAQVEYVVVETWKKQKRYLNERAKAFYGKLDELLPKTEIKIMARDKNENVFVLRTFTDRNPGSYYLYISGQQKLKKLADINSSIHEAEMCEMKPVSFTSRDGLTVNGYLTLPKGGKKEKLPVVVLPHNGPRSRNGWGYDAEVQFLANRGYAVFQINYRGSDGYGKQFMTAGFKQWGKKIREDVIDGVNWLIVQNIADRKRIAIYGTGFGGFIALNCMSENPGLFVAAASNSGVVNLFSYLKSIPPFWKTSLQMYYEIVGNPLTDVDYMRSVSPVFHSDRFKKPLFIAQNAKDPRVNPGETIQFVKELKKRNIPVTYLEKDEGSYQEKKEESRKRFYAALEAFLKENLKK